MANRSNRANGSDRPRTAGIARSTGFTMRSNGAYWADWTNRTDRARIARSAWFTRVSHGSNRSDGARSSGGAVVTILTGLASVARGSLT